MDAIVSTNIDDLGALGLSRSEIQVYLALLEGPRLPVERLAVMCGLDDAVVRGILSALQHKGLATRLPGPPSRYSATPPEVALGELVRMRREEIDRAHRTLAGLLEHSHDGSADVMGPEPVEILQEQEIIAKRGLMLLEEARGQVMAFGRPWERAGASRSPLEMELLRRGVEHRILYERDDLGSDATVMPIRKLVMAGEQARCVARLPCEMLIVDQRSALVVDRSSHGTAAGIIATSCVLVDALVASFDAVWTQGTPLWPADSVATDGYPSTEDRALLALMSAGLKDHSIARQLDVAVRTVERRVKRLMRRLGADTRFQLGMLAAGRGWLNGIASGPQVPQEESDSRHPSAARDGR